MNKYDCEYSKCGKPAEFAVELIMSDFGDTGTVLFCKNCYDNLPIEIARCIVSVYNVCDLYDIEYLTNLPKEKTYENLCIFTENLKKLPSGWVDGYEGLPIKDEAINKILSTLTIWEGHGVDFNDVFIKPIDTGDIEIILKTNE
ncbi:MAG TPA: hypothetical protein VLB82_03750 [Thermodesulfobacteriota bacterium]|nr:hypothetical protein [Thermodesulfobacteriota bacterium]